MTDVLVVGAGPTGLTLACLLRSHGVDVRVVDRLQAPAPLAKAMVLWSRTLEVLERLAVADSATRAGIPLEFARYLEGERVLASVRTNRVPATHRQPLILPQHELERLLRERLESLGVAIEWASKVTEIVDDGDAVSATILGANGATEVCRAGYAVGCDGLRSVVRAAAGIGWRDRAPYEEVFQLGDVEAHTTLDRRGVHHFLGHNGVSVAIPMPNDLWRVVGYLDGEQADGSPDRDALQRLLDDCGHTGTTIANVRWSGCFRVVRRLADSFRAGRLLVAGDAAHVHSPAGGQGLNTGVHDADNLAWKLAFVVRGLASDDLLDTYTTERRPIAARILTITEMQDKHLFGARSRSSRLTRNAALRTLDRLGVLERVVIPDLAQVRVRYRRSPLTVSGGWSPSRALAPGRKVPDGVAAPVHGSRSVSLPEPQPPSGFAIVPMPGRGRASALPEIEQLASRYPGSVTLTGPLKPPQGARGRATGQVIVTRPDGYIAYRGPYAVTPTLRAWLDTTVVASSPAT